VLAAVAVVIFACAGLVTIAERNAPGSNVQNRGPGLWWAGVTGATVGYGDHGDHGDHFRATRWARLAVFLMRQGQVCRSTKGMEPAAHTPILG
jgi:hypothetical protein